MRCKKAGWLVSVAVAAVVAAACAADPTTLVARGDRLMAQGKLQEAGIEYRRAIQQDVRYGDAHFKLGQLLERMGERSLAFREFVRAADLLSDDDAVQLKAGQCLLSARRFDEARKKAEGLLKKNVRNVDAQILLATATAGLNDLDAAVVEMEEAIKLDPERIESYANLAALELAKGRVERAEGAFRNALTINPKSIEARLGLANLFWANARLADAEALIKECLGLDASHALANRTLATFYLSTGRPAEAEVPLKALASDPASGAPPRLALADYYFATRRAADGVKLLEETAKLKDGYGPATLRLATYEYQQKRIDAAHARLDKLVAAEPKNPQALLLKAQFLTSERKFDQALERARAAVAAAPRIPEAHAAVGTVELARGSRDEAVKAFEEALRVSPSFAPAKLELAKIYLVQGRWEQSAQLAADVVTAQPRNADARYVWVRALMQKGDVARAEQELKPLLGSLGKMARVQALAGLIASARSDDAGARKAFEAALAADPNDVEALTGMVAIDLAGGRRDLALKRVEARLAGAPKDPLVITLAGRTYRALGRAGDAERTWRTLIEVDPGSLEAYAALGQLYYEQNRLDQAVAEFDDVAKREPKAVGVQTAAAFILQMQGKNDDAQKRYEKILGVDPRAAVAANNLAWLYAEGGGNLDIALQLAQTAKAFLPEAAEVADTLGWIYTKKGLPILAVDPLRQAVGRDGKNAVYRYHLGVALLKKGDKADARAELEQALKLDPNFDGAADARKALAGI